MTRRTQINTRFDNAPQSRDRCQGRRRRSRQSLTHPKRVLQETLYRNVVTPAELWSDPRSTSCMTTTETDTNNSHLKVPAATATTSRMQAFDTLTLKTALGLRVSVTRTPRHDAAVLSSGAHMSKHPCYVLDPRTYRDVLAMRKRRRVVRKLSLVKRHTTGTSCVFVCARAVGMGRGS